MRKVRARIDMTAILRDVVLENGQKMTLRRPKPDDAEQLIEYLNRVGGESDNLLFGEGEFSMTIEQEREYLLNIAANGSMYIVAFIGGELVGSAQLRRHPGLRASHNAELSITVRKAHWGKGIGKAMMEELIQYARNRKDIKNIHLGVKASNRNAIRMYEKFGFERIGVHKNYFNVNGTFDDEILMDLNAG